MKKKRHFSPSLLSFWIGCSFLFAPFQGQQIVHADPTLWFTAPAALGEGDCSSWSDACSLQTALTAAAPGDEIWVKAGVHYPGTTRPDSFLLKSGVALYGGFAGTESDRDQRAWKTNPTILSGDIDQNDINADGNFVAETSEDIQGANTYHVVKCEQVNDTALLDGFVITAGQADGLYPDDSGGGVFNKDSSPSLTNLVVIGNTAKGGGGMYNESSAPTVRDVTLKGNSANYGGGMQNASYSTPALSRIIFDTNTATENGGGLDDSGYGVEPILRDVTFINNSAGAHGGGFHATFANLVMSELAVNLTFKGNSAQEGGALYIYNIANLVFVNTLFVDNAADYGGAVYDYHNLLTFVNATFTKNTASVQGGALFSYWGEGPVLKNAIIWGNNAPVSPQIHILASNMFFSFSDIQDCGGSGIGWYSACGTDNGGNIDPDPQFIDPAAGDFRLGLDSPPVDAGWNAAVPPEITSDLDGSPRFQDIDSVPDTGSGTQPIVDMGAYEADNTQPTILSILRADTNPSFAASVNFTVTFSESVTSVDAGDFILTRTGSISGENISAVNGMGAVYTVAVSTGAGSGTLRLDIPESASVTDNAGNPLSGLPYTSGEVYHIAKFYLYLPLVAGYAP